MFTRRQFVGSALTGAAAITAFPAILRAQSRTATYPFTLGVTSGDPAPDGFVIWTKLAPDPLAPRGGMATEAATVRWQVATDANFSAIVASGEAVAQPELGHAVHVEIGGLQPERPYWYRFLTEADRSPRGMARTLPALDASPKALRFGVAGCQNYEDGWYTAFRHLAEEDLAFVYHYGDFIYEYRRQGAIYDGTAEPIIPARPLIGGDCYDLSDYRQRYAQYLLDPDLRAARARHVWLQTFDDHEIENNWAGDIGGKGEPADLFQFRKQAAVQAWYEHMPVRAALLPRGGAIARAWRGVRYGDLAALHLLDTRSWRTDQPCGDGFRPWCSGIGDPKARMISADEERWLLRSLLSGGTRWNGIAQQVMMMALDRRNRPDLPEKIFNLDSWAGYEAPRRRLLSAMRGLGNVVVLTGDEHQNFAGLLEDDKGAVAVEFVSTSISSGGDGSNMRNGSDILLAHNPQLRFVNDQRGYLTCTVTPETWTADFMVLDRVSRPGGALSRRASATVERGKADFTLA